MDIEDYDQRCSKTFKFLRAKKEFFRPSSHSSRSASTSSGEPRRLRPLRTAAAPPASTLLSGDHLRRAPGQQAALGSSDLASKRDAGKRDLRSEQFKASYETYGDIGGVDRFPWTLRRRSSLAGILGTLYLWGLVHADPGRFMPVDELARRHSPSSKGYHPKDAVIDLINRVKSDVPQIKYEKDEEARFEAGKAPPTTSRTGRSGRSRRRRSRTSPTRTRPGEKVFFWDFKTLEGVGDGGLFDGSGRRDKDNVLLLPTPTRPKRRPPA